MRNNDRQENKTLMIDVGLPRENTCIEMKDACDDWTRLLAERTWIDDDCLREDWETEVRNSKMEKRDISSKVKSMIWEEGEERNQNNLETSSVDRSKRTS